MKATREFGLLQNIPECVISVPTTSGTIDIVLRVLPEISDSKTATYSDTPVIGRSFPIKAYSHSENRTINMKCTFLILDDQTIGYDGLIEPERNLFYLRALQSAVYPREDASNPYLPPPICRIRCGKLLAGGQGWLCVVLRTYNVTFPTDVVWYEGKGIYIPYKFDVDLNWEAVYSSEDLPGQDMILKDM